MTGVTPSRFIGVVREADPVSLGIADIERPAGSVDDFDPRRGEPLLPHAPLRGRDPECNEVEPRRPVTPGALIRGAVCPLERDEGRQRVVTGGEPDAPVPRLAVLARPAPEHAQPEHVGVEALAAGEIDALDREVVDRPDHPRKVPLPTPPRHRARDRFRRGAGTSGRQTDPRRRRERRRRRARGCLRFALRRRDLRMRHRQGRARGRHGGAVRRRPGRLAARRRPRERGAEGPRGGRPSSGRRLRRLPRPARRGGGPPPGRQRVLREALRGRGGRPRHRAGCSAYGCRGSARSATRSPAPSRCWAPRRWSTPWRHHSSQPSTAEVPAPLHPLAPQPALAAAPPETLPHRPARAPEEPPPRTGDLARVTVPRLLVALHQAQATGALTVVRGPVKKILCVERGIPVYAASNVGSERFGSICIRRGVVTAERLDAMRRESPQARTGDLLTASGLLNAARRAEIIAGQIKLILWSMFEWREGSYELQLARPPSPAWPSRCPWGTSSSRGCCAPRRCRCSRRSFPPTSTSRPRPTRRSSSTPSASGRARLASCRSPTAPRACATSPPSPTCRSATRWRSSRRAG